MQEKENDGSVFDRFTEKTSNRLTDQLGDIAPDAEKWIHDFVFGTVYAREGLSDEEKAVATITTFRLWADASGNFVRTFRRRSMWACVPSGSSRRSFIWRLTRVFPGP